MEIEALKASLHQSLEGSRGVCELTLETWAPESISAMVSCTSIITGALLEHPTKWAMGSGLRKGTGATSGCSLFWAAFSTVNFGLGSGRECWRFTVGCCWWGVESHSLSSPQFVLTTWLVWYTPKLCGLNLDIWNTEVNWVLLVWNTALTIFGYLGIHLTLNSGPCSATSRYAVGWGGLSQTSLAIMGIGVTRSASVCPSPPMASVSGTI